MRKTIMALIIASALGFAVGCGVGTEAEHDDEFVVVQDCKYVSIVLDRVTGIEYIVYESLNGVAITPRLNPDEKPYVEE